MKLNYIKVSGDYGTHAERALVQNVDIEKLGLLLSIIERFGSPNNAVCQHVVHFTILINVFGVCYLEIWTVYSCSHII